MTPNSPNTLFGGAITAYIPSTFADASDFRVIPDNQEVFVDVATDQSIIIELLQLESETSDQDAARYHFQQLAEDNDAVNSQITSITPLAPADVPKMPLNTTAYILTGTQSITKFNETGVAATNLVGVLLAVIRLPHVTTDLVVSYNLPLALGPQSSSSLLAAARPANPEVGLEEFRKVVVSLTVVDWGLFN